MAQPQAQPVPGQSGLPVDNPTKSYWHEEPSEKLLGHRTTEELPPTADVVIVGSGITGAFAAHFLKEKKPELNVVMLEAREACWGATGRNGGHCQPAMYAAQPHIASFELRNFSYLKNLVSDFSIACDWHTTTGVHAYYSAELFAVAKSMVEKLTDKYPDLGANVAVVTPGEGGSPAWLLEAERRELTLDGLRVGGADGAVVQWHAASLWPYKLVAFVLERLLAANDDGGKGKGSFNLQTNTPVTKLSKAEPTATTTTTTTTTTSTGRTSSSEPKGGASTKWSLHTPRGRITAPTVLLATNGYTSHLLPSFADLLVPTKGQVSALKPPEQTSPISPPPPASTAASPPLDIGHTFYIVGEPDDAFSRDDYLIQRPPPPAGDAELVFGGGRQHAKGRGVGVWDDSEVDEPVSWYLRGELGGVVDLGRRGDSTHTHNTHATTSTTSTSTPTPTPAPGAAATTKKQDLTPTHEWSGIMGYSRDGYPFVGHVPLAMGGDDADADANEGVEEGLWLCGGYTGHGMPNATLCAKAVVDMMLGAVEVDLPPEYELTDARVAFARLRDEVSVVDSRGSLFADFGDFVV